MNLHGIVSGAIGTVNPLVGGIIQVSCGYTTNPDGSRTPNYRAFGNIPMQVQALTFSDLRQIDGLNLNGTRRAIYMNGHAHGVVRQYMKGGDLIALGPPGASFGGFVFGESPFGQYGSAAFGEFEFGISPFGEPAPSNVQVWLVALVLEQWPDWVKCAVTLQNGT